ncbi:MAG: hypothetical protein HRT56_06495 [Coraliomargarita sp.]|nr:hypothetical protein [Coraliomargarita sp.]
MHSKPKEVVKPADTPKAKAPAAAATVSIPTRPRKRYGLTINGKRIEVGVEDIV